MEREASKPNPERYFYREVRRNDGFPALQDEHPPSVVVWSFGEDSIHIFFEFKAKLEAMSAKFRASSSSSEVPSLYEEGNQVPDALFPQVCNSADKC